MTNAIKVFVMAMTTLAFGGISFAQAIPAVPSAPAPEKKGKLTEKASK